MVDKKGFIRTLEAVIAILLVLGFLLYILPRRQVFSESTLPEGIESSRNFILTEFLTNKQIRECVSNTGNSFCKDISYSLGGETCGELFTRVLDQHLIPGFDYSCEICNSISPCKNLPAETMEKSIYPGAVFMYFSGGTSKYVRVYFWRK